MANERTVFIMANNVDDAMETAYENIQKESGGTVGSVTMELANVTYHIEANDFGDTTTRMYHVKIKNTSR